MQAHFKNKKNFLFSLIILILVLANPLYSSENNTQTKSSLDIQSVQTKVFNDQYDDVYKSVLSVMQDNRFKITHSDKLSGIISADGTEEASENMSDAVATIGGYVIPFFGLLQNKKNKKWFISCNIEQLTAKKTSVRINITQETKKQGFLIKAKKKSKADDLTSNPAVYQALFAKIDKAIFIRKSLK